MAAAPTRPKTTLRIASAMLWRALTLRCPHCGGGPVLASWFRLKDRCPRCRLHLHREEGDYFLGAYMISLIFMEGLFAVAFVVVLFVTWPNPPWEAIQWVGVVVLVAGILIAYPFAKTLWLAIDLIFRPVSASELGWNAGDAVTEEDDGRR
ncbi:MAG: DUF983 domain-containing protein [Gemmatimonadaceae bacterium]|nr:DUF983 domain-containing protein [Gemmatimonadaceae bacterium]MDQ3243429.1 DUF983 domain-containing protein [Gemmatimonadota bacterium]